MSDQVRMQATSIATRASAKVGFAIESIISIITIALPLISQLMAGCGGAKASKKVATKHWDDASETFDSRPVKQLRPEMRRAVRIHNRKTGENIRPTRENLDDLAIETLRQAKDESTAAVTACMTAAAKMPVESDDE